MSLFKKPKKNFRSRKADDQSGDEQIDDDIMIIEPEPEPLPLSVLFDPIPTKKPKKKKKDKLKDQDEKSLPKSNSTLSFGVDEEAEEEVFQIKKSSHSKRIAKMLKREHKREQEEKAKQDTRGPGAYTAEHLKQLRDEQERQNGLAPAIVDMDIGSDVELNEVAQEDEKPQFDLGDDDEEAEASPDPLGAGRFRDMIADGMIPDASLIHLAKKRRQLARERGDDFIPLEEKESSTKSGSRLIREEDHDHSEDEEERVQFNVDKHEQNLRNIQNTILEAEQGSHSEDSDQDGEWEKQQIRKGVQAGTTNQPDPDDVTKQYQQFYFGAAATPMLPPVVSNGSNAPIMATRTAPPTNLPPITIGVIKKRLTDRLESLVSVHRAHVHERDDISSRMEDCSISIDNQSGSKGGLEERYRFFHEMRGYVGDLIECLSEKMTSINYLDRCMMVQWQQRSDKIITRRQQDIKDQAGEHMPKKAQAVTDVVAGVDEARQRRAAEREARRSRRRRARETRALCEHYDGLSTDEEENKSETIKLNMERDHITSQVQTMFDDVEDDFHNLNLIKSRFEDWKYNHGDSYQEAYIGLCLPKLFTPFIKLNLILWNPLEENCVNYEETRWYEALMFYSYREGRELLDDDVDIKLMPSIIEKILLPKLTALVETVWDPMSSKQTQRLCKLVQALIQNYPTVTSDSKYTQSLIQSIGERIKKSLEDDVFIPLYSKQILENRASPPAQFFHRQFWSAYKLLSNIFMCQGIISDATLQKLGLACLLNRYMILALSMSPINSDCLFKCQTIISVVPKEWFVPLDGLSTLPLLESFCRYLVGAANSLEKAAPSDKECRLIAREGVNQIRKMLVSLHAMDHAANLAS